MEKFSRAERRAQTARIKAKRKSYWGYPHRYWCGNDDPPCPPKQMDARRLGMVSQTPHPCSCPMGCGNARAFYGRSLKEIVQIIDMEQQMKETTMTF